MNKDLTIYKDFPLYFCDGAISLYEWGKSLKSPRMIQLMLWEEGHGPRPMFQAHKEPTDYVWVSIIPGDEDDIEYFGMMRKPTSANDPYDVDKSVTIINIPRADIEKPKVPMTRLSNRAAGKLKAQAEVTWKGVSELVWKILDDHENIPNGVPSAKTLENARRILKACPSNTMS